MRPSIARPILRTLATRNAVYIRRISTSPVTYTPKDARVRDELGRTISGEYAMLRQKYKAPKNPVVLCHGLMGFDKIRLAGQFLPGIEYWRGICDALQSQGVEVIVSSVPPSASIEVRAEKLAEGIRKQARGRSINLIGGIDARYMLSRLQPHDFKVLSLTTVATPHHGSSFADHIFETIGPQRLPRVYKVCRSVGMETGAFSQLTTSYMTEIFNPYVPDMDGVKYFSYGAMLGKAPLWSPFRYSHNIMKQIEGENDGLVSVASSRWGTYEGTLVGVSHLEIINWYNRAQYYLNQALGKKRSFNAVAFYCAVAENLAKMGF